MQMVHLEGRMSFYKNRDRLMPATAGVQLQ